MAVQFGPYYLNAETFTGASGVWTDSALTTCAPNGYYSNGVNQRYLSNNGTECVLGPVLDCPTCEPPSVACGIAAPQNGNSLDMFRLSVGLGSTRGVALVGIQPQMVPDGIVARFPSGSGTIIAEGSGQVHGYASNNNPSVANILENHIVYVGNGGYYDGGPTNFPGLVGAAGCGTAVWDCATYPVGTPVTSNSFDVYDWNNITNSFPPPGSPTGNMTVELTGYSGTSGTQLSTVTQMGVMGTDKYGVCQGNTVVANCNNAVGVFFIPIPKTTLYNQVVDVVFAGQPTTLGQTGFDFVFICPQVPTQFEMSDVILATNDPALVPACTDGTPGVYPNLLYQISLYNNPLGLDNPFSPDISDAQGDALYGNGVLAVNSFAYKQQYPAVGDVRWNEGGATKYEWYKVNLVTGGPNAYKTLKLNYGFVNWGESFSDTSALIQIDDNGIITNIIVCDN